MTHPIISPSVLSADFANLQRDIELINNSEADWFHIDIMDGVFVPNISFGLPVTEAIKKHATKTLDVHLMIVEPEKYIPAFAKAGADYITFHLEACTHVHRAIEQIKQLNVKAGIALNPSTPVHLLENIIKDCDLILLMSVNPGYGGQKFIQETLYKTRTLKELILKKNAPTLIEIDGGVNLETGQNLLNAGADALVAGSFVFNSTNSTQTIKDLKALRKI